jgi:uncharacterized protein (DUF488 family)
MIIHTIGFTRKSAEVFFGSLSASGVRRIVDTRLYNTSQLSGFAKQDDLRYFLNKIASIEYRHEPLLAPTANILDDYKKRSSVGGSTKKPMLSYCAAARSNLACGAKT